MFRQSWTTNRTFRLANLSFERLQKAVHENLDDMERILRWMQRHERMRLFRIGSSLIPFASHENFRFDWQSMFGERLRAIGKTFLPLGFRFSLHPGQYTVLNAPDPRIRRRAVAEVIYSCQVLGALGADKSHKVVVHAGGAYGDKVASLRRLVETVRCLPAEHRGRLVLENDERSFNFADIVAVCEEIGIPPVFDWHHHQLNPTPNIQAWLHRAKALWDSFPKVHISSQKPNAVDGAHDLMVRAKDLRQLLDTVPFPFDLMVEAKAKEVAALRVIRWLQKNRRFIPLTANAAVDSGS